MGASQAGAAWLGRPENQQALQRGQYDGVIPLERGMVPVLLMVRRTPATGGQARRGGGRKTSEAEGGRGGEGHKAK